MFETCDVCGVKFADKDSVRIHAKKIHAVKIDTKTAEVMPAMGDGSTGIKGSRLVVPTRTSNKSHEQLIDEAENRMGLHNFYGYAIAPMQPKVEKLPKIVKVKEVEYENEYVNFFKNLGTIEFEMGMR